MIASIRHAGLVVNDIEKSLNFWVNLLGFKLDKMMVESGPKIINSLNDLNLIDELYIYTAEKKINP